MPLLTHVGNCHGPGDSHRGAMSGLKGGFPSVVWVPLEPPDMFFPAISVLTTDEAPAATLVMSPHAM